MTATADLGPAPMVKISTEPERRLINKDKVKKGVKMKKFRDLIKESPVGKVGRTGQADALNHIENTDVEKRFFSIVKELGGKTVARELLGRLNTKSEPVSLEGDKTLAEKNQSPQEYLRSSGFKIKSESPTKNGFELEFFSAKDAEAAKEDITDAGYAKAYSINMAGKFLELIEI